MIRKSLIALLAAFSIASASAQQAPIGPSGQNLTLPLSTANGGTGATTAGTLLSKAITITRDLTVASGNVAYTGVGFVPTSCTAFGSVGVTINVYTLNAGASDSAKNGKALFNSLNVSPHFIFLSDTAVTNYQFADVLTYDADGFTLVWSKTAAPTGTATLEVICYR